MDGSFLLSKILTPRAPRLASFLLPLPGLPLSGLHQGFLNEFFYYYFLVT
jgi:hypothetical protein